VPTAADLDSTGLDITAGQLEAALRVDVDEWRTEVERAREHFDRFGDKVPSELRAELDALQSRLG
jgi:phosphoenolpyruvate carboxykinase (GTP)